MGQMMVSPGSSSLAPPSRHRQSVARVTTTESSQGKKARAARVTTSRMPMLRTPPVPAPDIPLPVEFAPDAEVR